MLPKAYEASKYEDSIYKTWEESGAFKADAESDKPPFTISMPPPNATGVLHLGHAVMLAIEDILIRHRRMKGYEALWLPGTDHAAIATESVVIKNLKEEEKIPDPRALGREKLIERIADYVKKSQGVIRSQIRKMGASCDWERERFTMDQSLNRCVNEVFKRMFDDGLIYRGKRVVNWDVALQTTISDDEVEYKEEEAIFYTFEYLSSSQTGGDPVYVGTSRPETKLGDTALAVHPDDERYKHLIGKNFDIEWPGGQKINVTVIADHTVDPEFGTGVVGITPFHSKTDYELWQRHKEGIKAEPIHVINEDGRIMAGITGYTGMTVEEARKEFTEGLRKAGKLKSEETYRQQLSISYRSKKPVEPLPKLQWFIDVNKQIIDWKGEKMSLKEVMQSVVKTHEIQIIPERFEKTYFHWIDNLQDWCISRQIWWGHRIPVWYCVGDGHCEPDCKKPIINTKPPTECPVCHSKNLRQDEDTLDTWFSSALWTWSTLVDPNIAEDYSLSLDDLLKNSPDFRKFHPTQVMETGYDILFFWIARMILMTTYATKQIPFETVYLHGLIRTRDGKKMSKSIPETCIDPLDMIEKYGADALRMSMVIGNTPGNDMRLYEEKIKGYRNFTNKLWNASRFVLGILEEKGIKEEPKVDFENLNDIDQWLMLRLNWTISKTDKWLNDYRIGEAAQILYGFIWNDFCDWYLELSKGDKQNTAILYYTLKRILLLLHPFIPFVTEQIWSSLPGQKNMIINEEYPKAYKGEKGLKLNITTAENIINVISEIRKIRAENKIEPATKIRATIFSFDHQDGLQRNIEDIKRLARLEELEIKSKDKSKGGNINMAIGVLEGITIKIPLEGFVDTEKERERLQKEIENLDNYLKGLKSKLSNDNFVKNAPEAIVDQEKQKLTESKEKLAKLKDQLGQF